VSSRGVLAIVLIATATFGCTKLKQGRCDSNSDCHQAGYICDSSKICVLSIDGGGGAAGGGGAGGAVGCYQVPDSCGGADGGTPICVPADAGTKSGMCVNCLTNANCKAATPICELVGTDASMIDSCRGCGSSGECKQLNPMTPVCVTATDAAGGPPAGTCVGCVSNTDCGGDGTSKKPVCELVGTAGVPTDTCRACAKDAECDGPGVCMEDGHCASADEVLFVDEAATTCGDGSTAQSALCLLPTAVGKLSAQRHVIVILGPANEQLSLSTTNYLPVIIGRQNSAGVGASIVAAGKSGISVSSDTVLVRDLQVTGGTAPSSKGVIVTGPGTSVKLVRVMINLIGGGLGVDAESGTTIVMDESNVESNPAGGIVVNAATAQIQNTVIAAGTATTGTGIQFNTPGAETLFSFDTLVGYPIAATSNLGNTVALVDSIVVGPVQNCTTDTSVTTMPTFSPTNPYHLTGHLACPKGATNPPDHDIDGQPRVAPVDCGADQFVSP
jgi:hypothetical protein